MSIIQQIREKAAWLVFIIIGLSLLGFLLMDAKPGQGGLFGGNSTTVGKVEGKKIELAEYQGRIKQMEDQYAAQGYPMNEMMRQNLNLEEQVWNQFIQEEIMEKEVDELGLEVTSKEIDDLLFVNPSPELKQSLTNPQTGQYDPNQLKTQIAEIKKKKDKNAMKQVNDYIVALSKQRLMEKYSSLLGNSSYVPKWMIEKMNAENSSIASISYVNVPYAGIADSTVKVSDDEINSFVSKHKDDYKQEVTRGIYYVSFDASATKKDSADVFGNVAKLKEEFATTTDAPAFLIRYASETPFHDGYITKSKLQVPNTDTIRSLANGAVYGPYLDGGKYTMAKMLNKIQVPDSVKVRHILIKIADQKKGQLRADSTAKNLADSIERAVKGGADFNELVLKYSDDDGSKYSKGEYEFGSTSSLVKPFYDVAFYEPAGTKKIVKAESNDYIGYHYIEVLSQRKFEEGYKIAYFSKSILPSPETDNAVSGQANQFAGESRTAKAFDDNAAKYKYNKLVAADIKPNDRMIRGLGTNRQLVKWIYAADKGDVSEPYGVDDKYVVAMVSEINEEGTMSASKARPMVEHIIRNKKKSEQIISKIGSANTLDAIAKATASEVRRADSVSFQNGIIPNVGQEAKVVGASFNKENASKVSRPIAGNGGVFVIKTENVSAVPNLAGDLQQQREAMLAQMKQSAAYRSMEVLRKAAKVKDERAKFF